MIRIGKSRTLGRKKGTDQNLQNTEVVTDLEPEKVVLSRKPGRSDDGARNTEPKGIVVPKHKTSTGKCW